MKSANLEELKNIIVPILKAAGATRSSIFGSYVRGEEKADSDVDILIELPKEKNLFDIIDLKQELEDALNKPVDIVEYAAIRPQLKQYILNEHIQIL